MIQIIHNPRCSKSRDGLSYLQQHNIEHEIIAYLDKPLTEVQIKELLIKLEIPPIELIRKNEALWKEQYKNETLSDEALIQLLAKFPKLIERPIFINKNKAIIGRPTENIEKIL